MNVETGEIIRFKDEEELKKYITENDLSSDSLIPVNESDMTNKQKEALRVSLNDNRSLLGKKRVKSRRERNRNKREATTSERGK